MSTSQLSRWSGLALIIGGLILGIATVIHPDDANDPGAVTTSYWTMLHIVLLIGNVIAIPGLLGLYVHVAKRAGWLGLIGFLLNWLGILLFLPLFFFEAFVLPPIAADQAGVALLDPAGPLFSGALGVYFLAFAIIFAVGQVLFGAALSRASVPNRWVGWLFILVAPGPFVPPLPHIVLQATGLALIITYVLCGYAVWRGQETEPAQSRLAAA
ncbi:MAG: hypothetical protein HYZ49_04400 [Chloroflexi bacterium]|nr:hypothetical protein [Chloroflexota bacterium]